MTDIRRVALVLILLDSVLFAAAAWRWRELDREWRLWELRANVQAAMDAKLEELSRQGELE